MKKTAALSVCLLSLLLMSCSKNDDLIKLGDRLKLYKEEYVTPLGNYSNTYAANYDQNGLLIELKDTSDPGNKITFGLNGSTYITRVYNTNTLNIYAEAYLNTLNELDSTFQYEVTSGDSTTEKYLYNAGKLVKYKEYNYSKVTGSALTDFTDYTYDASGNIATETDMSGQQTLNEYYDTMLAADPLGLGSPVASSKIPKRLLKKQTIKAGTTTVGTATYTYKLDSKNRITYAKAVSSIGGTVIKTYTYY